MGSVFSRENVAIAIALLSLGLSLYAFWRQNRANGRAHFTAEWMSDHELGYLNHGPGPGRDVAVRLDGKDKPIAAPAPYVGALQSMKLMVIAIPDEHVDIVIEWSDNRRKRQSLQVRLPTPPPHKWPAQHPPASAVDATVRALVRAEIDDAFDRANRGF